ncbi:MAG: SGNH/GDSL hydrolase family protein [Opitutaceae bacterium]|nr:SGNH/GDSL hydrolase family protein [Opitutaceae bacterium]
MKRDRWSRPFKKMVTLGESHTAGISATRRELGWAPVLKGLIDQFQEKPVTLVNQGIGADILSPASPMYAYYRGWRPIGLERYGRHVIAEKPDLVIVSYGYNDLRSGTPVAAFERDLHRMLADLRRRVRGVIVLLDTYFITADGYRDRVGGTEAGKAWNRGSPRIQARFNRVLRRAAAKFDLLFAEVSQAQGGAEWLICSPDGRGDAHCNDLGHRLIAQKIFEVLASNCRGLSLKAQADRQRVGKSPWRHEPYRPGSDSSWEEKLIRDFYPDSRMDRNQQVGPARPGTPSRAAG